MKRFTAIILCFLLVIPASSCVSENSNTDGISVVATLFPQYDFAKAILGEKGDVTLLLSPGMDSHNFEITPSSMQKINNSDLFVYTGKDMEIWVDSILSSIDNDVFVLDMASVVRKDNTAQNDKYNHIDPHIWTSISNSRKMLAEICDAICAIDPKNSAYYINNKDIYDSQLIALDSEFEKISAEAVQKTLYFSGAFAFHYFVEEYGFSYVAPFNSCSDVQIESIAAIEDFIGKIKENNVKYVFYQELSKNNIVDTVVDETGVTPLLLHSAHNVSKTDFDNGITYISIMQDNAVNLRKALCNG